MDCAYASELLSPYVDDMLDEAEACALRSHLSACAACGAEYARLVRMREALLRLPAPPLPADFDARLRRAVAPSAAKARARAGGGTAREAVARSRRRRRLLSSVAAVFAIGLLSLFVHSRFDAAQLARTGGAGAAQEDSALLPSAENAEAAGGAAQEDSALLPSVENAEAAGGAAQPRVDYLADARTGDASDGASDGGGADAGRSVPEEAAAPATDGLAERPAAYERHEWQDYSSGSPARGTTTSAHRLNEKALCDELLREKLAGWDYEILWEEKRDDAWVYRVNLIGNETGTRFDQEVEIHVSGNRVLRVYYATEFMGL